MFLFSLSLNAGDRLSPQAAAAMLLGWPRPSVRRSSATLLYAVEETAQARLGLVLLPAPVQGEAWPGKALAGLLLMAVAQCVFVPAVFVFLGQHLGSAWLFALMGIALGDVGMAASGSLLGALSVGRGGRESLLSIVLFPLLVPMLLAGVRLVSMGIDPDPMLDDALRWTGLAAAFDGLFLAAGLLLFPFVYSGDDRCFIPAPAYSRPPRRPRPRRVSVAHFRVRP